MVNWELRPLLLRRYRLWFNRVKKKSRMYSLRNRVTMEKGPLKVSFFGYRNLQREVSSEDQ